jgi:hypothetical protein
LASLASLDYYKYKNMNIVSDRIGIILKYGKHFGSITKRYFYIDNDGYLYYTDDMTALQTISEESDFYDQGFIDKMGHGNVDKRISLRNTFISPIKIYLSSPFDGRSYFELIKENRTLVLFAWKDEDIGPLREYIVSFNLEAIDDTLCMMKRLPSVSNDMKLMEGIIGDKLNNKYVNQNNWQMKYIKVVNPDSDTEEYDWIELDNGSNYSGPVKDGMPNGEGKEYRPDGVVYAGSFFEGKWHGFGTLTLVTLDTYSGEFINGCISGI